MKQLLRELFARTLTELDPRRAMAPVLARYRDRAARGERFLVLAYGKAARAMASAVVEQLAGARLRGLVVPPEPDDLPLPPFEVIAGGHPLPTEGSLRAGARALELARSVEPDETVLFLASGGGSAMLESPLVDGVTLDELRTFHRALVGSGADILEMNRLRQRVSAVKGGRLAQAAMRANAHATLTVNDVHSYLPSWVASGPSTFDGSEDRGGSVALLDKLALWDAVPRALVGPLRAGALPRGLQRGEPRPPHHEGYVADGRLAVTSCSRRARSSGLDAAILDVDLSGTDNLACAAAAAHLLARLERLHRRRHGRRVAVVAGGELSVPLPHDPGTGGRNQQFVLACARRIRGRPITVMSAGTDGVDGNSPAAGALADGHTMARARRLGLDAHDALRRCDAFPLLHALGDTIVTGPTGTNVRDLRVLVHHG